MRIQLLQQNAMPFTPQDVGVPIDHQPRISIDRQEELATQLCKLKGTVKALFDIITNTATEDNKREADSQGQEPDR
uniref:EKC/KEOPS complex subunit GON7 n=1 Tax=Romanomermis culicivorax TaxID=13658 RepID=A0A915JCE5_ROMCU